MAEPRGRKNLLARAMPAAKEPRIPGAPILWEINAKIRIRETMIVGIIPAVLLPDDNREIAGTRSFVITGAINKKMTINANTLA